MKKPRSAKNSATGIEGLDSILTGGLRANRLYLVKGTPGVGKTTLALQYLLTGVAGGEKGLYIALSETAEEIQGVADSHGWDLSKLAIFELSALEHQLAREEQNTVFQPSEIELNQTTELLLNEIKAARPARLVIDSLSELRLLSDSPLRYRRQMLAMKQFFARQRLTVLLLDDHSGADGGDLHVQSIAHGVITIEQIETGYGADRRRVKINKLRGVNFLGGFHDADIVRGGLRVFPRLVAAGQGKPFKSGLLSSGLAELDALVGGGIDRGTSCLLLGPAGTGKSTLCLQFALAAAARGEKVVIYLFEENRHTLLGRATSVGMPLQKYLRRGLIELVQVNHAEVSPGQFTISVREAVEERGARIIIIDSLNGYLQAMPNTQYLELQLHELFSFLSLHGVVSLSTVAEHGIVGQMSAPVDLTYLADTVILLRYFEAGGRVRKAVSVVKKRMGRHEDTIREFKLSKHGIQVGAPLENFQGVLTGLPTFIGSASDMLPSKQRQ